MGKRVAIVGTGQTYHCSIRRDVNGQELIKEAVDRALADAELAIGDIDGIVIGNMDHFEGINYVDCWSIDGSGGYMKPVIKLTTGGTTGTTLAIGGYNMVASGMFDRLLVIGWEKNSESDTSGAIVTATDPFIDRSVNAGAVAGLALDANAYMAKYGAKQEDAARVAVRDRKHACNNPHAHLRKEVTLEEVMESTMLADPLKLLDLCPRTDGACAVVFAGEDVAEKITPKPAWVLATANRHSHSLFSNIIENTSMDSLVDASLELWKKLDVKEPLKELDVIELYQPYSWAGLMWIEDMGLCAKGEGAQLLWDGVTDMGGELPINPSGGVIATNPIGATGLIRCAEIAMQIQGKAGDRQVPDVEFALATGFGGCYWTDMIAFGSQKPS
ncbi:MAG: thiolase family protein [Proteobacteria bacterium]|nr:thiolase family protein [Pseudomonadota bacterium]